MRPDDGRKLEIWYAGLNSSYRAKHPTRLARMGTEDDPRERLGSYFFSSLVYLVISALMIIAGFAAMSVIWLLVLFLLVAGYAGSLGFRFLKGHQKLKAALDKGDKDLDLRDEIRLEAVRRAVEWGSEKGIVEKEGDGYRLKQ